eukprot:6725180-Prymnesium_polylepis.1
MQPPHRVRYLRVRVRPPEESRAGVRVEVRVAQNIRIPPRRGEVAPLGQGRPDLVLVRLPLRHHIRLPLGEHLRSAVVWLGRVIDEAVAQLVRALVARGDGCGGAVAHMGLHSRLADHVVARPAVRPV